MRGACKTVGGKLVAVTVAVDDGGAVRSCRLDGDFFVETDASRDDNRAVASNDDVDAAADADAAADRLLQAIGDALVGGQSVEQVLAEASSRGIRLVGTNATAIETAYRRALGLPGMRGATIDASRDNAQRDDTDELWNRLRQELTVVRDAPRSPREQMELDERWAREVAAGERPATLRFWEWAAPCVVVGRFQSVPDEVNEAEARVRGFEIVRRCTGGGAMFVSPSDTITYSLYAPAWFVDGIDVASSYRHCDRWLVDALRGLGLDVGFSGLNDIASRDGKIGGAAQRRFPTPRDHGPAAPGAVLHHVTLAYDIDADAMTHVLNTNPVKLADKAVRSARKRVCPLVAQTCLTHGELLSYLIRSVQRD